MGDGGKRQSNHRAVGGASLPRSVVPAIRNVRRETAAAGATQSALSVIGVLLLAGCWGTHMGRAQEACGSDTKRGEEDRVEPLSTNRNKVGDPQSLAPEGLPRHDPACCVLAPRRWHPIDVVATPCIRAVAPAKRSGTALRKAASKRLDEGSPVHSFQTLLQHLSKSSATPVGCPASAPTRQPSTKAPRPTQNSSGRSVCSKTSRCRQSRHTTIRHNPKKKHD